MLRFKILVSVVPLMVAAILARVELVPGPRPCIAVGDQSVQIASMPWHADLHVSFTDDPAAATVRVQIAENAEAADFAVVDDVDSAEENVCEINAATQFVAISAEPRRPRRSSISRMTARPITASSSVEDLHRQRCRSPDRRRPAGPAHPRVASASL